MWAVAACVRTPPRVSFSSLLRRVAFAGSDPHFSPPHLCGLAVAVSSRRGLGNRSKDGEEGSGAAEQRTVERVEGESVPVKGSWGSCKWRNEEQQQSAATEAITQLFQDSLQRRSFQQEPGRTLSPQTTTTVITTTPEEDEMNSLQNLFGGEGASSSLVAVETVEQELLDDAFLYFPPASSTEGHAETVAAGEAYVPGQQIVSQGSTRYRVDVQYQGSDFDGWWKSTSRQLCRREKAADGTVRRVPLPPDANELENASAEKPMSSRYHARTVLEEALAVALDVHSVKVVAGVIPEVGVSVRRLCCHLDVPSHIELQPRTIIQRATMWLEKRQQPLAILSCQRCKNQDFHARHSGVRRVYLYRILNRVAPPLFDAGLQWHVDRHLDVPRMQRFAKALEGTKDFGYFADPKMANALRRAALSPSGLSTGAALDEHYQPTATGESTRVTRGKAPKVIIEKGSSNLARAAALPTFNEYGQRVVQPGAHAKEYYRASTNLPTIRTIDRLEVVRQDDEVLIWFVGKSFLRHQIRNMVSLLKAAGHGLWDELELQQALQSGFEPSRHRFKRDRFPPAPVYGLTLWDVEYPAQHRDDYVLYVDSGPYEEVDTARNV
ncbi:tRNA pseudouridine synthase A-like protein [Trypanosoma rangeli SC58]|uniref:tRNA pseudouridine synthase A-like protein n=1 Tax=Trypanosoma rangeli SC58 TaxID=429131 RepID=A0A061J6I9_TRYRA|nr:tRNA pseudouridine synthase A-like protein [Trypanosoma rangeli SC58]